MTRTTCLAALAALALGCPGTDPKDGDTGDTTTGGDLDATGHWTGSCDYLSSYTSVDRVDMVLDLVDAGGTVTGTMSYTSVYTGTTSSYTGAYGLVGTRTGDAVDLSLVSDTTSSGSSELVLTLEGDALDGTFDSYGSPLLDCSFTR